MQQFTSNSLVQLGQWNANSACALGAQVDAATKKHKLNAACAAAIKRVRSKRGVLLRALRKATLETPATTAADPQLTGATLGVTWTAMHKCLDGSTMLTETVEAPKAAMVLKTVFPEGLGFLRLDYRAKWTQSGIRLDQIDENELGPMVDELIGARFLKAVRVAQRDHGVAVGITVTPEAPAEDDNVRTALLAFNDALRDYVVVVTALQQKKDKKSKEMSQQLLQPLAQAIAAPTRAAAKTPAPPQQPPSPPAPVTSPATPIITPPITSPPVPPAPINSDPTNGAPSNGASPIVGTPPPQTQS